MLTKNIRIIVRLSISQKLMLALLGLTLMVLIATLGLARWSFERGFLDYVNALEQTRLTTISEDLSVFYVDNGSTWVGINERHLRGRINFIPLDEKGAKYRKGYHSKARLGPPPSKRRPPPPKGFNSPKNPPVISSPPTALFDMQGSKIAGPKFVRFSNESINIPVVVSGQAVGILKSEPKRKLDSSIETAFSRQQWITSGVIGIASLLFAALVSWLLVGLLLSPVRKIINGVSKLSKGDYTQRILSDEIHQDELGRLMVELNYLTQTLEKNQSVRRRWIADISHELRTPLSVLTGEVEALKDGIRPFNKEHLVSIDQEIKRLRHLTDDLYELSISDLGGLRYEFKRVDLVDCVKHAIQKHQNKAGENDLDFSYSGEREMTVDADEKRIDQLMTNLIRNSLAYTDAPGQVSIEILRKPNTLLLNVSDTPPGVTEAECINLFEPLYRQDSSRARRGQGAGLGLAICKNIVEAHRGTITAKPSAQGGLLIMIELPLDRQMAI